MHGAAVKIEYTECST